MRGPIVPFALSGLRLIAAAFFKSHSLLSTGFNVRDLFIAQDAPRSRPPRSPRADEIRPIEVAPPPCPLLCDEQARVSPLGAESLRDRLQN